MTDRLSEEAVAMRIARELNDGDVVNVGFGLASIISSFIPPEKEIVFHSENGIVGYGRVLNAEDDPSLMNYNLVYAGGEFVAPKAGMAIMDFNQIWDCVWTRRLDATVMGAFQVSEEGDLANWSLDPEGRYSTIGGAMDMPYGAKKVIVGMRHTDKLNKPKIVKRCSLPITAARCVNLIVTDVAVVEITGEGLLLREVVPGWTVDQVQAITEPRLIVRDVKEMELL